MLSGQLDLGEQITKAKGEGLLVSNGWFDSEWEVDESFPLNLSINTNKGLQNVFLHFNLQLVFIGYGLKYAGVFTPAF